MGVAVDEPGQHGGVAEVEDLRAVGRRLRAARIHRGDALAADQDLLIVQRPGAGPVDERRGAYHHDVLGRSTRKARPRQAQAQSSAAQVTHVETPRLISGRPAAAPWGASLARPTRLRKPQAAEAHRALSKNAQGAGGAQHFVAGRARTVRVARHGPAGMA